MEDEIRRTWDALRLRQAKTDQPVNLKSIVEHLRDRSVEDGFDIEEAESDAQVTALVSSLFLTHRGYADLTQEGGPDAAIKIANLHPDDSDFDTLTERINPKPEVIPDV